MKHIIIYILMLTTAYNTVPAQTDSTPCIGAYNDNICGRRDVAACPRSWKRKWIEVAGKKYQCLDVMNKRYEGKRIDLSFDKNILGAKKFGIKKLEVKLLD